MRSVILTVRTERYAINEVWDILTDIEKYPQRVKYVKQVKMYGQGEGSKWDDTSAILWVPIKMKHTVTSFRKNKEYSFEIQLYLGGRMKQKYTLNQTGGKYIIIKGQISYTLGNEFLNRIFGGLLNNRLKKMLESSVRFVEGEIL